MNQLTEIFDDHQLRIIGDSENPEFLLKDVCGILGLEHVSTVARRLDDDVVSKHPIQDSLGRTQIATFVNEDGLYDVIIESRKPEAKRFRKWITSEVIPSIRKTGSYQIEKPKSQAELMLMFAEQFVNQEKEIKELKTSVKQTNDRLDDVSTIVALNPKDWRSEVNKIINSIAFKAGKEKSYQDIRKESYQLLEARAKCDLERRLQNKRKNMALEGESKTKIEKSNKLDVIEGDSRLTEIYLAIIKELAIKYQVSLDRRVI